MTKAGLLASAVALAGFTAVLAAAPQIARAADTTPQAATQRTLQAVSDEDAEFAHEAAAGGMKEVRLGEIAVQRASDPAVKAFGQRLVDDHSKASQELMAVAGQKQLQLPNDLDPDGKDAVSQFSSLSGGKFDEMFIQHMVSDHQADIEHFKKEAADGEDADIKGFAAKSLPTLQKHLDMALEISGRLAETH